MSKPNIRLSSDLDRCSSREELEEVNSARTEQLAAELIRVVRPTLANPPLRRENTYIALDAVAWVAAIILDCTEDRDALDFFKLALAQSLADLETRDGDCHAALTTRPQAARAR